ncbi:MAG: PTS sugar transporter subunit IIB [Erysipelotrichaceae bacterium]|nr:PTS sugar transporter subunit IIB [Erysipelotrichaceae bacterium]
MFLLIRLDERLVHGQVATKLLPSMDVDTCVVVDDATAKSDVATRAIHMAMMGSGLAGRIKTSVKDLETAIRMLNDPRCNPKKIVIVTRDMADLHAIVTRVPGIPNVNLGNYGSYKNDVESRKQIAKGIRVDEKDAHLLKEIIATGKKVYAQMTPNDKEVGSEELLKNLS